MNGGLPFLTWTRLTEINLQQYRDSELPEVRRKLMQHWLQLDPDSKKTPLMVELGCNTMMWCEKEGYTMAQTSTFFAIVMEIHELCISTHTDNIVAMRDRLHALITRHSVQRPPQSIGLFTLAEATAMNKYMLETYFQHYKLYKYTFTPRYLLNLSIRYDGGPDADPTVEDSPAETDGSQGQQAAQSEFQQAQGEDQGAGGDGHQEMSEDEEELHTFLKSMLRKQLKQLEGDVEQQLKVFEGNVAKQLAALAGQKGK